MYRQKIVSFETMIKYGAFGEFIWVFGYMVKND